MTLLQVQVTGSRIMTFARWQHPVMCRGGRFADNGTTTTTVVIITILSHIRDRDVLAWKSMMLMLTCWYGCTRMIHGQLVGDSRLDTTPVDVVSSVELISSQSSSDAVFVTKQSPTYCWQRTFNVQLSCHRETARRCDVSLEISIQ